MPAEERRADEKTLSEVHYSCRQKPYRWLPQPSSSGVAHVLWHRQPVIISQRFADRCQRCARLSSKDILIEQDILRREQRDGTQASQASSPDIHVF
jgi:hypothetical protein